MITSYPLQINLGPIPITGFGVMMMLAFLMAGWLIDRELRRLNLAAEYAGDMILGAVVGGIVGAKLWFVALHGADALMSRSGLVWYGGFVGGSLGVLLNGWRHRVPVRWTAQLVAPALAAAYAIGRVGCFLVGDDYGAPTTLPWGVKFPLGAPPSTVENLRSFRVPIDPSLPPDTVLAVHPTQLYEVFAMTIVFTLLWRWRTRVRGTGWLFGVYLVFAGVERFLVEILRAKDDRLLGPFTYAQGMSVVLVIIGLVLMNRWKDAPTIPPGPWLQRPQSGA